jgi:hypothetical protein
MESLSMNRMVFGLVLALACVPLASCNRQAGNKTPAVKQSQTTSNEFGRRGGHGLRRACAADLQQYCPGQDRGRARRDCLQSHMSQLSADCKAAVEARGKGRRRRDDF